VIDSVKVFYRRLGRSETVWACVPTSGRWGRGFVNLPRLTVSIDQQLGRLGELSRTELERMVASARPSPAGRVSGGRYELPSRAEIRRMLTVFRRPLFVPDRLPLGFIFSDWSFSARGDPEVDPRRSISLTFGRDSLLSQVVWGVASGVEKLALECPRKRRPEPYAEINGRPIYVNEGIHGVEVWTCLGEHRFGNDQPLEISVWYDIRLHGPPMLHWATQTIATAQAILPR
jgi:hypothetical protein